jgi:hypothetical protein
MNGASRANQGITISSGKSSGTSAGTVKLVALESVEMYTGNGINKKTWRFAVNPASEASNELMVQYKDPALGWVTTTRYTAATPEPGTT